MRLTWSDVRARAAAFAAEWADETYERGEAQSFYNDFFAVFGERRRGKGAFEARVKLSGARQGRIDLFWAGVLLAEHKSAGADMIRARQQAMDYLPGIRTEDLPRFVLVCDFQTFELTDLDSAEPPVTFRLADLPDHVERFGFIMGVKARVFREQPKADVLASELMAKVHDALRAGGYDGADLERYLVRLLFCLFAEDTGIFEQGGDAFERFIRERTREDGSDLGPMLGQLWEVLDQETRRASLDPELAAFPYINGELFRDRLPTADFNRQGRERLLEACGFRWNEISPAIFGSLFQGVMNAKERRKKGAHYTTERNILKVIEPLFLDDLRTEFERAKNLPLTSRRRALDALHERIAALRFLDPACGCGNFLVITYRELRRLETELLVARYKAVELSQAEQRGFSVASLSRLNVDNFHGIELEEFPARIAEVALWMTDHIENNRLSGEFGEPFRRIPLKTAPHIVHGDALELDWSRVLPPHRCSYVLGNPPFIGAKFQTAEQRAQVRRIAGLGGSGGTLDYVAAWFLKAGAYVAQGAKGEPLPPGKAMSATEAERYAVAGTGDLLPALPLDGRERPRSGQGGPRDTAKAADTDPPDPAARGHPPVEREGKAKRSEHPAPRIGFVATNSITQGEQVAQLWPLLFDRCRLEIAFAHRTFAWGSDARGTAHVHVVIIGLARRGQEPERKRLFSYDDINADPVESGHTALTPYLFGAETVADKHLVVREVSRPINGAPRLKTGVQAIDDGIYTFTAAEHEAFLIEEPRAEIYFREYLGGDEYINGFTRWILYLADAKLEELRKLPMVRERVSRVRAYRRSSGRPSTIKMADDPTRMGVDERLTSDYLVIPNTSSEKRSYVPIGWLTPSVIANQKLRILPNADLFTFGLVTSSMHMAWMRTIDGRLESRYMYSVGVCYNTFPWPQAAPAARTRVEALAQAVLDARAAHPGATLADLYDPDLMPADLRRAHKALDTAVDRLYRTAPFAGDRERAEHLFGLYEKLTAGLLATPPKPRRGRKRKA